MRSKTLAVVVALVLLPAPTYAHGHTWDFFFGGGGGGGSTLGGVRLSVDLTMSTSSDPTALKRLAFVGDLTNFWGSHDDLTETRQTYQGGGRFALLGSRTSHYLVSAHALAGVAVTHLDAARDRAFAFTYGGSVEWAHQVEHGWGIRVQLEGVTLDGNESFFQGSVGVVKRF